MRGASRTCGTSGRAPERRAATLQANRARLGRVKKKKSPGQATGCRVKLLGAQLERFNRGQWLGDCRGLVMPPTPSEADGRRN
jgi:hypothetical protein